MTTRVELPRDNWATIREADELPERIRTPLLKAFNRVASGPLGAATTILELVQKDEEVPAELLERAESEDPDALIDGFVEFNHTVILAFVTEWSYDVPVDETGIGEIPGTHLDALLAACPLGDVMPSGMLSPDPDPDSPTTPSRD